MITGNLKNLKSENGKLVIEITKSDVGYHSVFRGWRQTGYACGIGDTIEEALSDLSNQAGVDLDTLRFQCEIVEL